MSSANSDQEEHSIPLLPEGDDEAVDAATNARDRCTALIRDHLDAHLEQNPNSSYISWIATLHPENAKVTLDPRFHLPGNPWIAVYEEARGSGAWRPSSAHPFDDDSAKIFNGEDAVSEGGTTEASTGTACSVADRKAYGGLIDLTIGALFVLTGLVITFSIEIVSIYTYLSSVLCWRIASLCSTPRVTVFSAIPFGMCFILYQLFRLVDTILLFLSVFMVELIAAVSAIVCTILSLRLRVGRGVHQRTRRLTHLTRWAFRRPFEEMQPRRKCSSGSGRESFAVEEEEGRGLNRELLGTKAEEANVVSNES